MQMFEEAISLGYKYKNTDQPDDFMADVMNLLEETDLGEEKDDLKLKGKEELDKLASFEEA